MAAGEQAAIAAGGEASLGSEGARLLQALATDPGLPARCWPLAVVARRLGSGPPRLGELVAALTDDGWEARASAVMAAQVRSDAPWTRVLELARQLVRKPADSADGTLDR
jgi:tRNA (guanine26-N2/guanine27-N2)-dimethyltransferase